MIDLKRLEPSTLSLQMCFHLNFLGTGPWLCLDRMTDLGPIPDNLLSNKSYGEPSFCTALDRGQR